MPQPATASSSALAAPPFGIGREHLDPPANRWARVTMTFVFIGGPILAALLGLLGGGDETPVTVRTPAASLTVEAPQILRSGNWFETLVTVAPAADVANLTISIDQPLWRGMSIDTAVPDAEKAEALDGTFTYSFGPVKHGQAFVFKLDGQIQPRGMRRLAGTVAARDGDRLLARVPLAIQVLP
jgi:hypothetical protein